MVGVVLAFAMTTLASVRAEHREDRVRFHGQRLTEYAALLDVAARARRLARQFDPGDEMQVAEARQLVEQRDVVIARVRLMAGRQVADAAERLYDALTELYDVVQERNGPASELVRRATKDAYQDFANAARAELGTSALEVPHA